MVTFPDTETNIAALAEQMIDDLNAHSEVYPTPVIPIPELEDSLNQYKYAQTRVMTAQTQAQQAIADKQQALQELIDKMKSNLRYAESVTKRSEDKLKLLSWGRLLPKNTLEVPGIIRDLEISRTEPGTVVLHWQKPINGGKVSAYKVQRFEENKGVWTTVAIETHTEALLLCQQVGKPLIYRVMAINSAGEGTPSNTVEVVL
ncbi:MAG: fibronectin type III domain-containing protein [Hormoscilla sp.]